MVDSVTVLEAQLEKSSIVFTTGFGFTVMLTVVDVLHPVLLLVPVRVSRTDEVPIKSGLVIPAFETAVAGVH